MTATRTLPAQPGLSAAKRALLEARLQGLNQPLRIARTARRQAPLSFAQERLWFLERLQQGGAAYNVPVARRVEGALDVPALEHALGEVVRRHEVLRTTFQEVDGVPVQVVAPFAGFALPVEDLAGLPEAGREAAVRRRATEEAERPFDLPAGPPFRAVLLRLHAEEHVLFLCMHHIVGDGWSIGVLFRDLWALYDAAREGRLSPLDELPVQYADYAAWQREQEGAAAEARQLAWWRDTLAGIPELLELPTDRPRPPLPSYRGGFVPVHGPAALLARLRELARAEGATLYMVVLAAFQLLLARYAGTDDVAVGTPVAGRTRPETHDLVGLFVNTLVLRGGPGGDPTFRQAVRRARECVLGAWAHQDLPFEKLVSALRPERSLSHSALFQVMYQLDDAGAAGGEEARRGGGVEVEGLSAKFDLTLSLGAHAEGLDGALQFATDLFDRQTAVRMAAQLLRVLEQGAAHPDRRCSELDLLGAEERRRVVEAWNETEAEYAAERRIHALVAESAARTPDAVALVYGGESLTFGALEARANRLAHHLVALGAGPEARVGVCLERSAGMVVAMLAVLKAGAAYLPLDPAYPAGRLAYMLRDSGASLLVTHSALRGLLDADGVRVVAVDGDAAAIAARPADAPRTAVEAGNAAYVIYTSGSTGTPKGVVVTHGNAASFFAGMDGRVGGTVPGTWLALTRISFDIHVLELLWTLARGFKVVVQPELAGAGAPARRVRRSTRPIQFSLFYFSSAGEAGGEGRYRLLLEGARFADRNGFHAVWTPERHFHAFGGAFPNPAVAGAAVAAVTERIGIRAGSVVLPLHDPLRVAEEWSVVDNLSNGRVGISFASGWQPDDFVLAPERYAGRREGMFRDVETVRALWRGEPAARTNGVGREIQVRVLPRPVQPELPVWITAGGSPDTFRRAGQAGAAMLTHLLGQSLEELAEKIRAYRQAYRESGAPGEGHVTLMLHTFVGSDLESVRETVRAPFKRYLATSAELLRPVAEARGLDMAAASPEDMDAVLDHAFERYWQSAALMGTPDSCGDMVERLRDAGVDEIGCLIDFIDDTGLVLDALHRLDEVRREAARPAGDGAGGGVAGQIRRHGVTHLQCTPSLASVLIEEVGAGALAGLDRVLLGGEPLAPELAARITAVLPEGLVNLYGPTETTVWSTTHAVRPGEARIPIGLPIANTRVYVLDPALRPQPAGVPGELFIGGPGVARGYLNRPALTAERFLPDPFGAVPGARLYRTGDRVRWRAVPGDDADARTPGGGGEDDRPFALEFMGRVDAQVKVRGFRIEPGEIESAIRRHPGVRDCAVVAREDRPGDPRLAAYLTAEGAVPEAEALRAHLRGLLPEYMVPASFTLLPALPRLPNGKLDRRALPAPAYGAAPRREPPATVLEAQLLEIWQELLGAPGTGVTQSFFDLGGDSFLALRLVGQVARRLGAELPVATLFEGATVREMARAIQAREGGAPALPAGVVPLQPRGSLAPLFCVHPAGRRVLRYLGLARTVGADQPMFGLEDVGEDLARPLVVIAADHVRAVRAVQPRGPYALAGWSFGGLVAWEMAAQLEGAGERVSFLGMLDSMSPVFAQLWPQMPDAQLAVSLAGDAAAGMRRPFSMEWRLLQGLPLDEIVRRVVSEARARDAVPAEFDEAMLRRHCAEIRDRRAALEGYVPGSFSGTLTLFRATEDRAAMELFLAGRTEPEKETMGWCRHAHSVRVLPVPGSHVTMGSEPHVQVLARRLREALADAGCAENGAGTPPVAKGGSR